MLSLSLLVHYYMATLMTFNKNRQEKAFSQKIIIFFLIFIWYEFKHKQTLKTVIFFLLSLQNLPYLLRLELWRLNALHHEKINFLCEIREKWKIIMETWFFVSFSQQFLFHRNLFLEVFGLLMARGSLWLSLPKKVRRFQKHKHLSPWLGKMGIHWRERIWIIPVSLSELSYDEKNFWKSCEVVFFIYRCRLSLLAYTKGLYWVATMR